MDNKKKIVFGVLLFAILGIGVFQFTGSSEEPVVVKTEKPAQPEPQPHTGPNSETWLPPVAIRDPFMPASLPNAPLRPEETVPQPEEGSKQPPTDFKTPAEWEGGTNPVIPGVGENGGAGPGMEIKPVFSYTLVGVMLGDTPAAVFADAQGNQKLITLGGEIDGDSRLVSLHSGKAIVKFQNQTLTLTIGGTASAK